MKKIVKMALICTCVILSSCKNEKTQTRTERIQNFNKMVPKDEFMVMFINFIKENKLTDVYFDLQDNLIKKKYLEGLDNESSNTYFKTLLLERENWCIDKNILEKINGSVFSKFNIDEYKNAIENNDKTGSAEYKIWMAIVYGTPSPENIITVATETNNMTEDVRCFYFIVTCPLNACN